MRAIIEKSEAKGRLFAPTSKSAAHRLLICAALAEGESVIYRPNMCDDILATIDCLRVLGADITAEEDKLRVRGFNPRLATADKPLYARESGSTLRFMLPIALLCGEPIRFCGAGRLMSRPMGVYEDICRERGLHYLATDEGIVVKGPLPASDFTVRGDISSQFITGLMLALPLLSGDRRIKISTAIESKSYIDMTMEAMRAFGVTALWEDGSTILVKDGKYTPAEVTVEGDYSGAAFPAALGIIHGGVEVLGLNENSLQGDKVYQDYYKSLKNGFCTLDITDCPDLGPILFTLASIFHGAHFTGTARLSLKESDRATVMAEELRKFGADISVSDRSVTIKKTQLYKPSEPLFGHGDHRIVMSLAVLCTLFGGEIKGAEAVSKSYPGFFSDLYGLGIKLELEE